ncbi:MAG: outer membrane lipoprotein-sorting protein [Candidatus Omnitrophica bacterium]|nr:outer membrane lipoprotein-sorting protein [Candidatus Omnitrophota bacterium]
MKKSLFLLGLAAALFSAGARAAEPPFDAKEVARKAEERYIGDDLSTALQMQLIDASGKTRRREFLIYRRTYPEGKKTLYKFLYPEDIKDTATLNEEVKGAQDIQHLFLPAARKLRRISTKNQSWMGSDFIYEDLEEINLDDYRYEAIGFETLDGYNCYVYAMVPLSDDRSAYGKQIRWIRRNGHLPVKIEYYDKQGQLLKVARMTDLREEAGAIYAWDIEMKNVRDSHRTVIRRRWIFLNTGIPDDLLTTRALQKPIEFYNHPAKMWETWKNALAKDGS